METQETVNQVAKAPGKHAVECNALMKSKSDPLVSCSLPPILYGQLVQAARCLGITPSRLLTNSAAYVLALEWDEASRQFLGQPPPSRVRDEKNRSGRPITRTA